jgi:acyl-[acyl-carrier-protein] desaturase
MAQVSGGQVPQPETPQDGFVYVALQELATRIAHFNTAEKLDDPAGKKVMKKVASDENRHHLFYRDLASAAFELDPSGMMLAAEQQVRTFEMPGTGIKDFGRHAKAIADAGIYDMAIHHDKILEPIVVKHWDIENISGLSDEAEIARDKLLKRIERIGRAGVALAARAQRRTEQTSV